MSNIPKTLNEVRRDRASTKRKITNLLKEGDSLTQSADSGLPSREFIKLAEQIRVQLDVLHANNEQYINLKCSVLVLGADATEEKRGVEEETIADTETKYLDEVRDRAVPMIHELIKISEHVLHRDSPPIPISTAPTAQMQKLKFPTFSGDIREYKRFRELFIHFTNHLNHIECLYQLVECMQRPAERNKIKPCTDYHRAWQILDEHYGDDDRLVDILLRDIENLNSYATKGRVNLAEMETFTESIQNFITQVEGINMTQDLNGRLLVTQIRRKLPEEHCLLFLQRVADGKSEDSVYGLAKWLNSHLILLKKINSQSECVNHSPFLPTSKSAGQSTVSPGGRGRKENGATPKCPIHTDMSNHFLKGCYKFRNLTQAEKFDLMNTHEICHRCGHNNCVAGNRPLARNNFLPVLESWVIQLFQLGVRLRRAAATVTMGDIAGRFTSDVTARLPSAAMWSACSLTVTFCTCGGSTGALLALKNPFIVVLFDETFDLTRRLRYRSYFVMLAIRLQG